MRVAPFGTEKNSGGSKWLVPGSKVQGYKVQDNGLLLALAARAHDELDWLTGDLDPSWTQSFFPQALFFAHFGNRDAMDREIQSLAD